MNTQVPRDSEGDQLPNRPIRCLACGESTGVYWSNLDQCCKVMLHDNSRGVKCPMGGTVHPGDGGPAPTGTPGKAPGGPATGQTP